MSTVNPNTTGLLGLQNPVESTESLLNIDFAAIGPIGQTGPTGYRGHTGPTGPTYIYQKTTGNLSYTGLSLTIETPTNNNLDGGVINLATAGSANTTTLRSLKSDNTSIFDVLLQGGNNPTMRVQTDGSFVRGYMAADSFKTPNWTINQDGSNNLQIYDTNDNNPVIVIDKTNPKIRITPTSLTPAVPGAKLVLYESYGDGDNVAYSGLGHRSGSFDVVCCDPTTSLSFRQGTSANTATTFAGFAPTTRNLLINKTTDSGEKLQVEGDITCTNIKPTTSVIIGNRWTINNSIDNHLTIRDSDNNPNMAFFNSGAITVYQTTPNAQFNLSASTAGNTAFFGLYTVSSNSALRQNDAGSLEIVQNNNGNINLINGSGRVLMGSPTDDGTTKLQVNGDIRNTASTITKDIVFTAQTQPALKTGQLIYNSSNNKLQFCDGTSWHNISP